MSVTISGVTWGDLGRFICPPILDGNGNIYLCAVNSSDLSKLKMMKSSNGGTSFSEVDSGGAPDCGNDIDAVACVKDGTTIHVAFTYNNTMYLRYSTFTMSDNGSTPDEWVVDNEAVYNGYVMDYSMHCDIAVRSDGDVLIVHSAALESGYARVDLSRRESGSWTTISLDAAVAGHDYTGAVICMGENDLAHIFYSDSDDALFYNNFTSANSLSSPVDADGAVGNLSYDTAICARPVYYDDDGVERITYGWIADSVEGAAGEIDDGGTPGDIEAVTHDDVESSGTGWATIFCLSMGVDADEKKVYFVYSDATDSDLYYVTCTDSGTWSSETELEDGVSVVNNGGVNATVYTRDNNIYLAYTFNDGGTIKFAEEFLYSAANVPAAMDYYRRRRIS